MRAAALLILAMLGAGGASAKDRDATTEPYTDADWGYKLLVPFRERATKDTRVARFGPDPEQSTTAHSARFAPSRQDVVLTVTVIEIPPALREVPAAVLYEGAKRGLVGPPGFGATLAAQENADFKASSGEVVTGKGFRLFDGKHHIRARVVAHDGRLYQLTAVGTDTGVVSKTANDFLAGLVLTARGKP